MLGVQQDWLRMDQPRSDLADSSSAAPPSAIPAFLSSWALLGRWALDRILRMYRDLANF